MKEIIVDSKKFGIKYILVDDDDYDYLIQWKWSIQKVINRDKFYAVRTERIPKKNIVGDMLPFRNFKMHRVLLAVDDPQTPIDHRDGNGLNNQRSNLRVCTWANNSKNRRKKPNSSSKYLGVHKSGRYGKPWRVRIFANNRNINVGSFDLETDAAKAYNEAAQKLHGEFANLNQIAS